jgi:hypothetical protein
MVNVLPEFDSIQPQRQALYIPKIVQYNGCNLCDVWGGSASKKILVSVATLTAGMTSGTHDCLK